jgi:hypothetical protein
VTISRRVHRAYRVADQFPDGRLSVNLRGYDVDQPALAAEALRASCVRLACQVGISRPMPMSWLRSTGACWPTGRSLSCWITRGTRTRSVRGSREVPRARQW